MALIGISAVGLLAILFFLVEEEMTDECLISRMRCNQAAHFCFVWHALLKIDVFQPSVTILSGNIAFVVYDNWGGIKIIREERMMCAISLRGCHCLTHVFEYSR